MDTIYLDNAATSFPKPERVYKEVDNCLRTYCGNPGRSAHRLAMESSEKIYECRERLASFFSVRSPERIIFTQNTTYALNMAIKGLTNRGDHILISDMEHNSVYRPVAALEKIGYADYSVFKTVSDGRPLSPDEIRHSILSLIRPGQTKLLICAHVPNVSSAVRPIELIGDICRRNGIIFILDAAQSAGHIRIDMKQANVDILCAPGHKGLFGIQGCGFMILSEDCPKLSTLIEGGNGLNSLEADMPEMLPERLEAGTLPTPSIAALSEGVKFLSELSPKEINRHEIMLYNRLTNALTSPGIKATVYTPSAAGSVLLFNVRGRSSDEIGHILSKNGICVRSGYHCSALGHKTLGTVADGAVRVSFGFFNKPSDIDHLYRVLSEYLKA